jgi:NTP pyrophosphatase (non-canonical NTP hydrolase)
MDVKQYREAIKRTMNTQLSHDQKLAMLALGLAGEVGELVDQIKKKVYHGHVLDLDEFIKENGDVFWYLFNLMNELNISEEVVMMENVMKLQKRYADGFSEEASIKRVDTK